MSRVSQGLVGDTDAPAAIADHSFVFTTDDPGQTAASATTIADGDATVAVGEFTQLGLNLSAKINLILAALRANGSIQS